MTYYFTKHQKRTWLKQAITHCNTFPIRRLSRDERDEPQLPPMSLNRHSASNNRHPTISNYRWWSIHNKLLNLLFSSSCCKLHQPQSTLIEQLVDKSGDFSSVGGIAALTLRNQLLAKTTDLSDEYRFYYSSRLLPLRCAFPRVQPGTPWGQPLSRSKAVISW